jgi:hypothetical protein
MLECPGCGVPADKSPGFRCPQCDSPSRPCSGDSCQRLVPAEARYCGGCGKEQSRYEEVLVEERLLGHSPVWRLAGKAFRTFSAPSSVRMALSTGVSWTAAGRLFTMASSGGAFHSLEPAGGRLVVKPWFTQEGPGLGPKGKAPLILDHYLLFFHAGFGSIWALSNLGRVDHSRLRTGTQDWTGRLVTDPIRWGGNGFLGVFSEGGVVSLRCYEIRESRDRGENLGIKLVSEAVVPGDAEEAEGILELVGRSREAGKQIANVIRGANVFEVAQAGESLKVESMGEVAFRDLSGPPMRPFVFAGKAFFFRSVAGHATHVFAAERFGSGEWQVRTVPNTLMAQQIGVMSFQGKELVVVRASTGLIRFDPWNTDGGQVTSSQAQPVSMELLGPIATVLLSTGERAGSVMVADGRASGTWCFHSPGFSANGHSSFIVGGKLVVLATRDSEAVVGMLDLF